MSSEMDPQLAEVLRQAQRIQSAMDEQAHQLDTESFRGADQAKTVGVTLNGRHWLTGLYIEDGLLRLGTETVAQRINEAIRNAQAAATTARDAEQERLMESMADIAGSLKDTFGFTETKPD